MKPGRDRYTDRYIRYTHFLAMNTACQTLLSHDPTRHDSLLLLANPKFAIFQARPVTSTLKTRRQRRREQIFGFLPQKQC